MEPKRISVAIASPGDVHLERDAVLRIFNRWHNANDYAILHAVMWEHAAVPSLGAHPQSLLNKAIIEKSDLLVAILWSKLGSPTPTAKSGTVEEIREFVAAKGPGRVMLYFCTRDLPHDVDPMQLLKLNEFKADIREQGLYHEYKTVEQFENDLYRHLDLKVQALLTNQLPLPRQSRAVSALEVQPTETTYQAPDPRLRELIDLGATRTSRVLAS